MLSLTFCLVEVALFLWFRQASPTVLALFLTSIFYVLIGLTQAWFEKRLFRSVILEYFWVSGNFFRTVNYLNEFQIGKGIALSRPIVYNIFMIEQDAEFLLGIWR